MKKKYGLFKVLAVLLFLVVIATYFIAGRSGDNEYLALVDVFFNYVQSFYYFFDTALFLLVVGGFYGVLNRIPAYRLIIDNIVKKIGKNKKLFVIISTVVFALLSSLTGLNLILLIFVPFVVSIILLLGYDKLVALSSTIGGIVIGIVGGIFVTVKDSSSQYGVAFTTFEKLTGLKHNFNLTTTLPKCLLLVAGIVLLVLCIINHIKNTEEKKEKYVLTKNDPLLVEVRESAVKSVAKTSTKKEGNKKKNAHIKVWPFILVVCVMTILLILGYMPWSDLFGVKCFDDFHTWLTGLTIGDYTVFTSLISNTMTAFGKWAELGSFMMAILLLVAAGLILSLIYKVKLHDAMDGFIYGVKKLIPATMVAMFAYAILVSSYNNGFMETVITNAGKSFGDNVIVHSLISVVGSVLNVDVYYSAAGIFSPIVSGLTDKANLSVYAIMFQSIYGIVQIVGPTSLLLIFGLSYLEVPYKTWVKYIWRLVLELFIAIFVVLMIVSLL